MTPKEHLILIARKKTLLPDEYEPGIIYPGVLISTEEYTGLYLPGDFVSEYTITTGISTVAIEGEIAVINQLTSNTFYYLIITEQGEQVDMLRIDSRLINFVNRSYRYRWLLSSNNLIFKPQLTY